MQTIMSRIRWPVIFFIFVAILMTIQSCYLSKQPILWLIGLFFTVLIWCVGYYNNKRILNPQTMKTKVYFVSLGLLLILSASGLYQIICPQTSHISNWSSSMIFYLIVIAPSLEEIIYRQILYTKWLQHYGIWLGRIVSGLLFVWMHFPANWESLLFYILATCGLFIAYEGCGHNVKWSIGLHMLSNMLSLI